MSHTAEADRESSDADEAGPSAAPLGARQVLAEGEGWRLRRAGTEDAGRIGRILREVPFGDPLELVEEREPDVLALRRAQANGGGSGAEAYLVEDEAGAPVGCLSLVVRAARMGSNELRLGCLADLRLAEDLRGGCALPMVLRTVCQDARERHGAQVFTTTLVDPDFDALIPFLHRDRIRYEQPMAQVMSRLHLVAIPAGTSVGGSARSRIETASEGDGEDVVALLARGQAMRTFGEHVDASVLSRRLAAWPDFGRESFLLARDGSGAPVGCVAPWNVASLRRFRYRGGGSDLGMADGLRGWLARLRGGAHPPELDAPQRAVFLTHLEVPDEDPTVLRDLLRAACERTERSTADWTVAVLPEAADPDGLLRGVPHHRLPLSMLALTPAGTVWNNVDFRTARPAVEAAFL